jgi:hypothetical protein
MRDAAATGGALSARPVSMVAWLIVVKGMQEVRRARDSRSG